MLSTHRVPSQGFRAHFLTRWPLAAAGSTLPSTGSASSMHSQKFHVSTVAGEGGGPRVTMLIKFLIKVGRVWDIEAQLAIPPMRE